MKVGSGRKSASSPTRAKSRPMSVSPRSVVYFANSGLESPQIRCFLRGFWAKKKPVGRCDFAFLWCVVPMLFLGTFFWRRLSAKTGGTSVAEIVVEDRVHENHVLRRSNTTDSDWVREIVKIWMAENRGYL